MTGEEHQLQDLGWLAAPMWMLLSAVEIASAVSEPVKPSMSLAHHLIDALPGLIAAGIGILHWWSINKYREKKLENELKIAQLEVQPRRRPGPSSGDERSVT